MQKYFCLSKSPSDVLKKKNIQATLTEIAKQFVQKRKQIHLKMQETATKQKKFERTTHQQLAFYVSFCKDHPELQAGKNNARSPRILQDLWQECAESLNAMRGPTRTAAKWKETLAVWKSQLRSRARKKQVERNLTGGGPGIGDVSEFEQQALQTFGAAAVDGIAGVSTLGMHSRNVILLEEDLHTSSSAGEMSADLPETSLEVTALSERFSPAASDTHPFATAQHSATEPLCEPISVYAERAHTITSEPMSSTSRIPRSPVFRNQNKKSLNDIYATVMHSIERRDKREERMIEMFNKTSEALCDLSSSMKAIANALSK